MTTHALTITPTYDLLLRGTPTMPIGLYQLHLATAGQLTRLHYKDGTLKTVKKRLKVLADHGYVVADSVPTKQYRSPYYYTLGPRGIRYLMDVSESLRAGKETDKHYLFVGHALELTDLLIAALQLRTVTPDAYLAHFIHERDLKRIPYKVTQQGQPFSLIPDAFLEFRRRLPDGRQQRIPILLEHDRGTEQQQYFRRRIRAYLMMLRNNGQQSHFGVKAITIAFSTFVGPQRLAVMREWTRQEVGSEQNLGAAFWFASLSTSLSPRQVWLEPQWYPLQGEQAASLLGT